MGNAITNNKAQIEAVHLSNGAMSVLMDVLALSASDTAKTLWEKRFAVWIAQRDQDVFGIGMVGFDVSNIPWTVADFDKQKDFVLHVIELALQHHLWDALGFNPNPIIAHNKLDGFRKLIESLKVEFIDHKADDEEMIDFQKCPIHKVYLHFGGCIICNDTGLGTSLYQK